jgi:tetratricopeptide (TPR) repeat protein
MSTPAPSSPYDFEVARIRELSRRGLHGEALAKAEMLAAEAPASRDVLYLIAANLRCLNRIAEALKTLEQLEQQHPRFSLLHQERGYCYTTLGEVPGAIDSFQRAVNINPALADSWRMLERIYGRTGDLSNRAAAAGQVATLQRLPHEIVRAGSLFSDGDFSAAENLLRAFVLKGGNHVEAMRLLARIERQRNALEDAERLLEASLKEAPNYHAARVEYISVLIDRQKYPQAQVEISTLLKLEPENRESISLSAATLAGLGDHEASIALYRQLLAVSPGSAELHVLLGHSLQAVGRQSEATNCYHAAAAARSAFGDAYWSLANLKTYRFSDDEIAHMRAPVAAAATSPVDRTHLCFALGKAYEDRKDYAQSWQFYARGNALKRAESHYRPEITETNTRRQIEVCTAQFFARRPGTGAPDPDPIFIVGLPRSGSTLIEQILASHSQVEGTQELADIQRIVLELEGRGPEFNDPLSSDLLSPDPRTRDPRTPDPRSLDPRSPEPRYPGVLAELSPDQFRRLGERYLTGTRAYRKGRPLFTDKMPNNFRHIGLIHLMLPNAKIIDVRREPMACCFGNLKQLFARGQEFTYSMEDIARYYRTYLDLMRHWDAVLSGRVLRVCYEDVVEDLEGNVRRILEFCRLDFEPACIEYYKTERSVRTASSEQVRQPIFHDGLFQWRNYEPWLGPLREALGDAVTRYSEQAPAEVQPKSFA